MHKTWLILALLFLSACSTGVSTADTKVQSRQELLQAEAESQAGLPNIHNFAELKNANLIYEERDRTDLITYIYMKSEMTGRLVFVAKGMGYGLPYATQRSNPQKVVRRVYDGTAHWFTLPQPEPNILFMPASADATWQFVIDKDTKKVAVVYFEDKLNVSPIKLPCINPENYY